MLLAIDPAVTWTTVIASAGVGAVVAALVNQVGFALQHGRERELRREAHKRELELRRAEDTRQLRDRRVERLRRHLETLVATSRAFVEAVGDLTFASPDKMPQILDRIMERGAEVRQRLIVDDAAIRLDVESESLARLVASIISESGLFFQEMWSETQVHVASGGPLPEYVTSESLRGRAKRIVDLLIELEREARQVLIEYERPI